MTNNDEKLHCSIPIVWTSLMMHVAKKQSFVIITVEPTKTDTQEHHKKARKCGGGLSKLVGILLSNITMHNHYTLCMSTVRPTYAQKKNSGFIKRFVTLAGFNWVSVANSRLLLTVRIPLTPQRRIRLHKKAVLLLRHAWRHDRQLLLL